MRFRQLSIPAWGPFTGLQLDFGSGTPDFHVIHGPNEAGKSSLLRGITHLLYGIPTQSGDNFLHAYKDMRLAAEIESRSGQTLSFQRRKGNQRTLLGPDDSELPSEALEPFLGSVDQPFFETMFGLGSVSLRDGAAALLKGKGQLGTAIFSANLGGTPVQQALDALRADARRLFAGRAHANVTIRPAVRAHTERIRESRTAVVSPEDWSRLTSSADAADAKVASLQQGIDTLESQCDLLQRCRDAISPLAEYRAAVAELELLPPMPELPADFPERTRSARTSEQQAASLAIEEERRTADLEAALADCPAKPDMLAHTAEIESLHAELGAYRQRREALATFQHDLAAAEPALRSGMATQGLPTENLPTIESLRLTAATTLAVSEAADHLTASSEQLAENRRDHASRLQRLTTAQQKLASLPETDPSVIGAALRTGTEATDAHASLPQAREALASATREVTALLAPLGLPQHDPATVASLPVPLDATIRSFRERFAQLETRLADATLRRSTAESRAADLASELERMERRGTIPSETDLAAARQLRSERWHALRRSWQSGQSPEPFAPPFEEALRTADELADRLRHEAETVAQAAEKRHQIISARETARLASDDASALRAEITLTSSEWQELWNPCSLAARTPGEMEEWRTAWTQLRSALDRRDQLAAALERREATVNHAIESLSAALGAPAAAGFSALLAGARDRFQAATAAAGQRRTLEDQIAEEHQLLRTLDDSCARLTSGYESATERWRAACTAAGLPPDASPATGKSLLDQRSLLLSQFDTWRARSAQAETLATQQNDCEQRVACTAARFAIPLSDTEATEAALWKALADARAADQRHRQLAAQLETARERLQLAGSSAATASATLSDLLRSAHLTSAADLDPFAAALESRAGLRQRIDGLTRALSGFARSQPLAAFLTSIEAEATEDLPIRHQHAANALTAKRAELRAADQERTDARRAIELVEAAGSKAADARQAAASIAASLRDDAARFLRLRLATSFLEESIARFREANQAPMLRRSGEIFAAITASAFTGLQTEFSDDDEPTLTAMRRNGRPVAVEHLSEGSRDQLFLALRLAALEAHLASHEPMPLILDDLLVTFDDERTCAILPVLAAMAARTQVLLFTHHEHLLPLCSRTLGEAGFRLHRLTPAA
jgi:uncharacterized protein YhaN